MKSCKTSHSTKICDDGCSRNNLNIANSKYCSTPSSIADSPPALGAGATAAPSVIFACWLLVNLVGAGGAGGSFPHSSSSSFNCKTQKQRRIITYSSPCYLKPMPTGILLHFAISESVGHTLRKIMRPRPSAFNKKAPTTDEKRLQIHSKMSATIFPKLMIQSATLLKPAAYLKFY